MYHFYFYIFLFFVSLKDFTFVIVIKKLNISFIIDLHHTNLHYLNKLCKKLSTKLSKKTVFNDESTINTF